MPLPGRLFEQKGRTQVAVGREGILMDYDEYLKSDRWMEFRQEAISKAGWKCQRCGLSGRLHARLQVHHRHYRTLGRESLEDVEVLCRDCHQEHHQGGSGLALRKVEAKRQGERVRAFMEQKFGPDWEVQFSVAEAELLFIDWHFGSGREAKKAIRELGI